MLAAGYRRLSRKKNVRRVQYKQQGLVLANRAWRPDNASSWVVQPLVSLVLKVYLILALSRWLMWLGCLSKLVKWLPVCCLYPKRNKFYLLRRKLRCLGSSHSTLLQPLPVAFASRKNNR